MRERWREVNVGEDGLEITGQGETKHENLLVLG